MKLKQLLCKHDYSWAGSHKIISANLWKCKKCNQLLFQHYGLGIHTKVELKDLHESDWDIEEGKKHV